MGYALDNIDLKKGFGTVVSSGRETLLAFPEVKEPFSHNWNDDNGIDVDVESEPFFQPRNISLNVWILASSDQEFWSNYRGLFALLRKPGLRRLYSSELNRSFYVRYTGSSNTNSPTRISGSQIGVNMILNFQEPVPSFWQQFALLTDENGAIITFNQDNNLQIIAEE